MGSRAPNLRGAVQIELPLTNPFAPSLLAHSFGGGLSIDRRTGWAQYREDAEYAQEDREDLTLLPSVNPFGLAGGGRLRSARPARGSVHVADSSEHEGDYPLARASTQYDTRAASPPPHPRRAMPVGRSPGRPTPRIRDPPAQVHYDDYEEPSDDLLRQRMGDPKTQLRAIHHREPLEEEDNRLVISWVGDIMTARPASPKPRSEKALPQRQGVASINSEDDSVTADGYASGNGEGPDAQWSRDDEPLFANIPEPPNPLDSSGTTYPRLPAPPAQLIREILARRVAEIPAEVSPPEFPVQNPKEFGAALELMQANNIPAFLSQLSSKELKPSQVDQILRTLTNVVQLRFTEHLGDQIINHVHLIPCGRLALGTTLAAHPTLDVDLVIPSDFVLRRWNMSEEKDELRPKTVADALDLDPTSIARGEVDAAKLSSVFQAIWQQLNGSADDLIFPGGSAEAAQYLPRRWCGLYKDNMPQSNRLRLITRGMAPVCINVFVKVALRLYGQEVVVGVDQSSAQSVGKYQMLKVTRTLGSSPNEAPLSPVDRTAILMLMWWKTCVSPSAPLVGPKDPAPKIRNNHFVLALAALRKLSPSDELYLAPETAAQPFSLLEALETMLKILKYLERAYKSPGAPAPTPANLPAAPAPQYLFPMSSCTVMDALYSQATAKPGELALVTPAIQVLVSKIEPAIAALSSPAPESSTPETPSSSVSPPVKAGTLVAAANTATPSGTGNTKDLPVATVTSTVAPGAEALEGAPKAASNAPAVQAGITANGGENTKLLPPKPTPGAPQGGEAAANAAVGSSPAAPGKSPANPAPPAGGSGADNINPSGSVAPKKA